MNTFTERLTTLRKRAGLRQEDLADKVGVSIDTIRRWEGDKQEPRLSDLVRIAQTLNTTINQLVGEKTESAIDEETQVITPKPKQAKRSKSRMIVIQQGNTRVEIPATSQGYAILKDKLREISMSQQENMLSIED